MQSASRQTLASLEAQIGARMAQCDWAAAMADAAHCRAAWPSHRAGWLLGSIAALLAGDVDTALSLAEGRLAKHPTDVQCLLQKAECLLALGKRKAAVDAAAAAAAHAVGQAPILDAVGAFFVHAAEHARALEVYDAALAAAPGDPLLLARRAVIHRFLGHFDLAAQDHRSVLRRSPNDPDALKGLTELRRQSAEHNSIKALQVALADAGGAANPGAGAHDAATLHFALAKSHEDLGDHTASWRHLAAGNALERAQLQYDSAQDRAIVDLIADSFREVEVPGHDTTGERPIFIVGLPRTGTTLLERIIGNHSQVHAAGELSALSEAIAVAVNQVAVNQPSGPARSSWLGFAAALPRVDAELIAREYLARASSRRGERARFCDKQPVNFFYCALIFRAFPNARILHLTRHPLAACHAIYKTRFRGTYPFSCDLAELGEFFIGYHRLMRQWHRVLPGRILDVAYEDIVTALKPTTERVLRYLDLPFEEACLEFQRNPASTSTASAVQVRQPLYDSSLQRWRFYAAELAPLRARLEGAGIPID